MTIKLSGMVLIAALVSTAAFAESVKVTVDRASVWGNTTGTAGVIGVVRRGDVLEVLNHDGRWLFVVRPMHIRWPRIVWHLTISE